MGSFKLKLVAYFSLIALLPFAAAFSGLEAVTDKNETRRVDGTLETSVRAAQAAFVEEVDEAERVARRLAGDRPSSGPWPPATASGSRPRGAQRRADRAARRPADWIRQEALGRPLDRRGRTAWPSRAGDLAGRDGQPPRRGPAQAFGARGRRRARPRRGRPCPDGFRTDAWDDRDAGPAGRDRGLRPALPRACLEQSRGPDGTSRSSCSRRRRGSTSPSAGFDPGSSLRCSPRCC